MMKKTGYAIVLAGCMVFCLACTNTGSKDNNELDTNVPTDEQEMFDDGHYAAISLDYFGTYVGMMPCADCDAIQVEIVISADSTFRFTEIRTDGNVEPEVITGKWTIDRNTITFDQMDLPFHVAENRLIPIGDDGQRYTGELEEKFSLHKLD